MKEYETIKNIAHATGPEHAVVLALMALFLAAILLSFSPVLSAQTSTQPAGDDPGWPREYNKDGHQVVVYQPQIESWQDNVLLKLKCAIAVTPKGAQEASYGALHFETQTETDTRERMVLLKEVKIESLFFPNIEDAQAAELQVVVKRVLPTDRSMLVSLDRILAYLEESKESVREVTVNLEKRARSDSQSGPATHCVQRQTGDSDYLSRGT